MVSLSKNIIQIHYFGNKCLIKTEEGLIPQNEYVSFIIKYVYNNPTTINNITRAFINKFDIRASFDDVKSLVQNYIEASTNIFVQDSDANCSFTSSPVLSGTPDKYVPYLLNIELTNSCNLNCPHCYKEANCYAPTHIDVHKIEELLSFLNSHNLSITLTGGEPTIHKSFEDIVWLCSKYGRVDIVTNGLMLSGVSSEVLNRLNLIGISLYGIDNLSYEHNTGVKNGFSKLVESTDYLHSIGKEFILTIVLDAEKIVNLEKYINIAEKLGAVNFQIGLPFRSGRLAEKTTENERWIISNEEIRIAYRKIREYQKNNGKIKILNWEREVYETKIAHDDPNNPSNFYITPCMKCGAGTTQWSISEDFTFKPCNLLSNEFVKKIPFETFKNYVDGKHIIDWRKYMKEYKDTYSAKFGLCLSDCCKRLTDFIDET